MSEQFSVISSRLARLGVMPDEENVLRPEVAQRLVRYGLRHGLLRRRGLFSQQPTLAPSEEEGNWREEFYEP